MEQPLLYQILSLCLKNAKKRYVTSILEQNKQEYSSKLTDFA